MQAFLGRLLFFKNKVNDNDTMFIFHLACAVAVVEQRSPALDVMRCTWQADPMMVVFWCPISKSNFAKSWLGMDDS
jgi:hypothetical protein